MFRTQVQIWFQLEFPCNVPNLIKLMRVFSSNSNGIPCFCAHILSSATHSGCQGERWELEVKLYPGCSLCSKEVRQTGHHPCLPPSCLAFSCSRVFSVYWYGQRLEFRNAGVGHAEENLHVNCVGSAHWPYGDGKHCDPHLQVKSKHLTHGFFPFQLHYRIALSHLAALLTIPK